MRIRAPRPPLRRALIVGAALAVITATPNSVLAADQPEVGFYSGDSPVSADPDPGDVYVANADGTDRVNLTAGYGAEWPWAWSPDGSKIAFFSARDGSTTLYVRSPDASEPVAIAPAPDVDMSQGLAWSPDGSRVAFTSIQGGNSEILVADVAVRTVRNASNDPWESKEPRWSPTGSHLSYLVRQDPPDGGDYRVDVHIVSAAGGAPVKVTDGTAESPTGSWSGSWSPDGTRYVFVSNPQGNDDIYVADGDGRNPVRLTDDPADDREPAWSPDGTRIAFSSGLANGICFDWQISIPSRIHVINADGSGRRALTDGSIDPDTGGMDYAIAQAGPTWSPDGSTLAMAATIDGCGPHQRSFTVYAVDPAGSDPPTALWSDGGGWSVRWSPDGARVAISSTGNYGFDATTVIADVDGTAAPLVLTSGVGSGMNGWSNYGAHLAYMNGGGAGPGDTVFVAAPDGTDPVDITAGLDGPINSAAMWRPQPLGPVGLVDTATGVWYLRDEWGVIDSFYYGNPGDIPFLGDWDGDGIETPGLYRQSDGYVYLRNVNSQGEAHVRFFFGDPGDVPLAGDFDGDGFDTLSLYRPSEQRVYIIDELGENDGGLGAAEYDFLFGNPGDQPVVGDWDGDGIDEIGLHRESTGFFYYRDTLTTGNADGEFYFGDPGDGLVAGDWGVADGADTPAVFRPSNTTFYFRHTLTPGAADSQFTWPAAGRDWMPVAGAFTGD